MPLRFKPHHAGRTILIPDADAVIMEHKISNFHPVLRASIETLLLSIMESFKTLFLTKFISD